MTSYAGHYGRGRATVGVWVGCVSVVAGLWSKKTLLHTRLHAFAVTNHRIGLWRSSSGLVLEQHLRLALEYRVIAAVLYGTAGPKFSSTKVQPKTTSLSLWGKTSQYCGAEPDFSSIAFFSKFSQEQFWYVHSRFHNISFFCILTILTLIVLFLRINGVSSLEKEILLGSEQTLSSSNGQRIKSTQTSAATRSALRAENGFPNRCGGVSSTKPTFLPSRNLYWAQRILVAIARTPLYFLFPSLHQTTISPWNGQPLTAGLFANGFTEYLDVFLAQSQDSFSSSSTQP